MVIGDIIFIALFFWFCYIVNRDGLAIANAGKKLKESNKPKESNKKLVKVYPGTKIPMEPEHESSFVNTAMWMSLED
tara:strand:+ start:966 stop:1196 length:231 start_codon:yes stop_codon:yes gene_type:complete